MVSNQITTFFKWQNHNRLKDLEWKSCWLSIKLTWESGLTNTIMSGCYDNKVFKGSEDEPYINPRGPVHLLTGSAGSEKCLNISRKKINAQLLKLYMIFFRDVIAMEIVFWIRQNGQHFDQLTLVTQN